MRLRTAAVNALSKYGDGGGFVGFDFTNGRAEGESAYSQNIQGQVHRADGTKRNGEGRSSAWLDGMIPGIECAARRMAGYPEADSIFAKKRPM